MNSKDNKTFKDSLKQLFRSLSKGSLVNIKNRNDFSLTEEIVREIHKDAPIIGRLKAFRDLADVLNGNKLEDKAIEKLWLHAEDLLQKNQSKEVRSCGFYFLNTLIKTQYEQLNLMRAHFFRIIKHLDNSDDVLERFDLLSSLTENGKNVLYFEDEIGNFMLNWMKNMSGFPSGKIQEFFFLLVNVIKFNAGYITEDIVTGIIRQIYSVCFFPAVLVCLQVLDTIVCYSYIPSDSLSDFIGILCHTVNGEVYCVTSWKVMRNLLGTHMGHSALYILCRFLQEPIFHQNALLLRGSIFFINMALWGSRSVPSLMFHSNTALNSFLQVLNTKEKIVTYEILLSIQRLVSKHGCEMYDPTWETILDILDKISDHVAETINNNTKLDVEVSKHLIEAISCVEKLVETEQFNGSLIKYYNVIAKNSVLKPKASVIKLIDFLSNEIVPIKFDWLEKLKYLLQKFFCEESRTDIRLKVIEVTKDVFIMNRICFESELFEEIIIPTFLKINEENDYIVKCEVSKFLLNSISNCNLKYCSDILDIIEKMLKSFLEINSNEVDNALPNVQLIIKELIEIFLSKLYQSPGIYAVRIFNLIVQHLEMQYQVMLPYMTAINIRFRILQFLLKIRANSNGFFGYPQSTNILAYSPFINITNDEVENIPNSPTQLNFLSSQIYSVSLKQAFKLFITCLKKEKDWDILQLVLSEITDLIQNRAIYLNKRENNEIDSLAVTLFSLVTDKSISVDNNNKNELNNKQRADLHGLVFMLLANLTSYHMFLDLSRQQSIIHFLIKFGLVSRCAKLCIIALTACALEMKDSMVKLLPEVLLDLSKISPTVHTSIPVLEFLSTLVSLPLLYANFVCDQYMYIFAISLPYTNPFKYNHYTVSLAHHVIAVWFLKCRLPYRRDFVKFITTALQSNVLNQFGEGNHFVLTDKSLINEDSSNRKRSSSLTEHGSRRRDKISFHGKSSAALTAIGQSPSPSSSSTTKLPSDSILFNFYEELTETCIDLMARYAFSPCSPLPKRSPVTEFLLKNGNSQTWLLGNKVITITTSGCAQTVSKNGLCEKCWLICKPDNAQIDSVVNTNSNEPQSKSEKVSEIISKLVSDHRLEKIRQSLCACWCQGWAEIYIRRPTGDTAWTLKIQNSINYQNYNQYFPLKEISTLFLNHLSNSNENNESIEITSAINPNPTSKPISIPNSPIKRCMSDQSSAIYIDDDLIENTEYSEDGKARNPVRRSNSSPEMSATWKNHFLNIDESEIISKKSKNYGIDLRVSWEAIPEEMAGAGSTPPSHDTPEDRKALSINRNESALMKNEPNQIKSPHTPESSIAKVLAERPTSLPSFTSSNTNSPNKPPQSPTNSLPKIPSLNPIYYGTINKLDINKKHLSSEKLNTNNNNDSSIVPRSRDRGHTISVMSPARIPRLDTFKNQEAKSRDLSKYGVNPSFIFLQLYHSSFFGNNLKDKPLLVPQSTSHIIERSVKVLSCIPPFETHKIGVVYVGDGQCNNEMEILRNRFGSVRYMTFLNNLGTLISLANVDPQTCFLGGLERNGDHGKYAYVWQDDVMQVIFHVATLMPCKDNDPRCTNKKMHIGNNYVTIVYNASGEEYNFGTIKGQFNYVSIVIVPLDHKTNRILIKAKDELLEQTGLMESRTVSDDNLAILVRQLAIHANLASLISRSLTVKGQEPYASNWLERLRKIKNMRNKLLQDLVTTEVVQNTVTDREVILNKPKNHIDDFTSYT